MTDHPDTAGATAWPWSYEIQYGPNGEDIYALVHYHNLMACTVKVHHARLIVEAVNAYEPIKARLAEVERELVRERQTSRGDWSSQRDNDALIIELDGMKARARAAEARIAVLEKVLKNSYFHMFDGPEREAVRTALAAEQKEAGK